MVNEELGSAAEPAQDLLKNLRQGHTLSGVNVSDLRLGETLSTWLDMSIGACWEYFFVTFSNDQFEAQLLRNLEAVRHHRFVGDFLASPTEQTAELAAFGIVMADRLANAALAGADGWKCLLEILNLEECVEYVSLALAGESDKTQALAKQMTRESARRAANIKHQSTKQAQAKRIVRECWVAWIEDPSQYASAAGFARAMLDKFPEDLCSQVVVERWVRQWRAEN
jgi:hypothetical protein